MAHNLVLPTILFGALGAMSWAVRGSAGASAMNAHVAPGLLWGAAWWFLARQPSRWQPRRYASGWILFALTVGFALAGNRGWMQWHHLYEGHLSTKWPKEWEPISPFYGFLWFFLAGSAWAALPACLLAWCCDERPTRAWEWTLRIACGLGGAYLASRFFLRYPEVFLPKYDTIAAKYHQLKANPGLEKMIRDNGATMRHLGYCVGFLAFEAIRRDWKNVALILTVGILNGLGWSLLQNWKWAAHVWPDARFNFGRCWEVCAGISIGIAFGMAYYLLNRPRTTAREPKRLSRSFPKGEWIVAAGLLALLGWTAFWPTVSDLRRPSYAVFRTDRLWGAICMVAAAGCVLAAFAHRAISRTTSGRHRFRAQTLEWWTGLALMFVLGWFIRSEVIAGFTDGVRDRTGRPDWLAGIDLAVFGESTRGTLASLADLASAGNLYFCIVAVFCLVRIIQCSSTVSNNGTNNGPTESDTPMKDLPQAFGLEDLVTYLSLTLILIAAIGPNLITTWPAPLCFTFIAAAFGVGYCVLGSRSGGKGSEAELESGRARHDEGWVVEDPNLVRWGVFVGLVYGLGLSLRKLLKGGAHLYFRNSGDEKYWDPVCWKWLALCMLLCLLAGLCWFLRRRLPTTFRGDLFPYASVIVWLVLIAENIVAQVVTGPVFGPEARWDDFQFNLFYVVLFLLTAAITYHFQFLKGAPRLQS